MKWVRIVKSPQTFKGKIRLPASKSKSNRVLILRALSGENFPIHNLSTADDTILLNQILSEKENELYVNTDNAGTVMRFCTAYFACRPGNDVVLTGTPRMKKRPIGPLAEALKSIGADVEYREKKGFPPLHVSGKKLKGGHVKLDTSESSQFATALLLIAPVLEEGLTLEITGEQASMSYLELTLHVLSEFGIKHKVKGNIITIKKQPILPREYFVESDWSSAGYWYGLASLFPGSQVSFQHLSRESSQGDSIIARLGEQHFGITTKTDNSRVVIKSDEQLFLGTLELEMRSIPDLIPTIVTLCCLHRKPFRVTGSATLKLKESDRVGALKKELSKLGHHLQVDENSISSTTFGDVPTGEVLLETYNDHRLAMCWAIVAAKYPNVWIKNPASVDKSYPTFWEDITKAGFDLHYESRK
jgi:3-phosphoshikimate 1-carboxyvinyltransferase